MSKFRLSWEVHIELEPNTENSCITYILVDTLFREMWFPVISFPHLQSVICKTVLVKLLVKINIIKNKNEF